MTKLTLVFLALCASAWANVCAATKNGLWSDTTVWTSCGSTTPQPTDTITLSPYTVTIDSSQTVAGVSFGNAGTLAIIDPAVTLTVNGNATYGSNGTTATYTFNMTAGSVVINGSYMPTANYTAARIWYAHCTKLNPCTIGGSTGTLTITRMNGTTWAGPSTIDWNWVNGYKLFDPTTNSVYAPAGTTADKATTFTWIDGICTQCGAMFEGTLFLAAGPTTTTTLRRVRFKDSTTTCASWSTQTTALFERVVFDRKFNNNIACNGNQSTSLTGTTIKDSVLGGGGAPSPYGSFQNSLLFLPVSVGSTLGWASSMSNNILIQDHTFGNPEGVRIDLAGSTISGNVNQYLGRGGGGDTGTAYFIAASGNVTFNGNISLPQPNLVPAFKTYEGLVPGNVATADIKHNTMYIGGSTLGAGGSHGHSLGNYTVRLNSYQDNIITGSSGVYWLFHDGDQLGLNSGCASYTQTDIDLTQIGNNFLWPAPTNGAESGSCNTNSANAYGGKWSATPPGVPDKVANHRLADTTRSYLDFPTRYLGMTGTAAAGGTWLSGAAYTAGEFVVSTSAEIYNSTPILYYVTTSHTAFSDATPGVAGPTIADGRISSIVGNGTTTTVTMAPGHPHHLAVGQTILFYGGDVANATNLASSKVVSVIDSLTFTISSAFNGTSVSSRGIELWKSFYEYGTKEVISARTADGTSYIDGALPGCTSSTPCSPVEALRQWIRRGWTPQNPVAWCSGLDGQTAGAVPFCLQGKATVAATAF